MVKEITKAWRAALALVAAGAMAAVALPACADSGLAKASLHLTIDVSANRGLTFVSGDEREATIDANTGFGDYRAEGSGKATFEHLIFVEDLSAYAYAQSAPESFGYHMNHMEPGLLMTVMNTTDSAVDFNMVLSANLFLGGGVEGPTGRATARAGYLFTGVNSAFPDEVTNFSDNIRIDLPAEGVGVDYASNSGSTLTETLLPGGRYTMTLKSSRVAAIASAGLVPEPATWALMLSGFFCAGAIARRRSSIAVA